MSKIAFLFPGQGSQSVGMGHDLYETYEDAQQVFDQFNTWVRPDLTDVIFKGPEETLKRTLYTQPAILAVSMAALVVLCNHAKIKPDMLAGHSLGEYGALYAAGVLDLESTAKLVKRRAELMEEAPAGAMAAVLGLDREAVHEVAETVKSQHKGVLTVANYNMPTQTVISGEETMIDAACDVAKEKGARRALKLPVGGAFHSPLMHEAAQQFATYLGEFDFAEAQVPVVANVDAGLTTQSADFQRKLAQQMESSVEWVETIRCMHAQGVTTYIEIGPGKVLTGMVNKIVDDATVYNVYDVPSLQATLEGLKEKVLV